MAVRRVRLTGGELPGGEGRRARRTRRLSQQGKQRAPRPDYSGVRADGTEGRCILCYMPIHKGEQITAYEGSLVHFTCERSIWRARIDQASNARMSATGKEGPCALCNKKINRRNPIIIYMGSTVHVACARKAQGRTNPRATRNEQCGICGGLIQKGSHLVVYSDKHVHVKCASKALRGDLQEEKRDTDNGSRDDPPRESTIIVGPAEVSAPPRAARIEISEMAAVPVTEVAEVPEVTIPPVPSTLIAATARIFSPKSDSDYVAEVHARVMVKSRSHERLVRDFGEWARTRGLLPSTPHPRDLVLSAPGREWLVEAKVIYHGDAAGAARAAIGQLLDYRHFLYVLPGFPDPALLALFSEPIGKQYAGLLESLSIAAVWRDEDTWSGSLPLVL